jgi:endonuclease YncB( thermonuclease family)
MNIKQSPDCILPSIIVIGILGFFLWQTHEREINSRVDYKKGIPSSNTKSIQRDFQSYQCTVKQVVDEDSLIVNCDGEELKLRLCGIDAPEKTQVFASEARNKLQKLAYLNQGLVNVTKIELDRDGSTIAEVNVWTGKVIPNYGREYFLINAELVKEGLAYHYKIFSSTCHNKYFISTAEEEAITNKIGVWSKDKEEKPWDFRKRTYPNK